MGDENKTKKQLINELAKLRRQLSKLKKSAKHNKEEKTYKRFFNLSNNIFCIAGLDGYFRLVSPAFGKILGRTQKELYAKPFMEFIHPEDRSRSACEIKKLANGNSISYCENRYICKDGSYKLFGWTFFTDVKEGLMYAVARDITEHRKVEEELKKSESEKALILGGMTELVVHQDTQQRILWANRAAYESVGLTHEKLIGHYCYEIWHKRSKPCDNCPVKKALKTGQPQKGEMTSPDGRVWLIQCHPIRDKDGNVASLVEITQEITARKQAEGALKKAYAELEIRVKERTAELLNANEALKESEKRFRVAATSTSDLLWEGDVICNSLFWHGNIDAFLGYEQGEFPRTITGHMENIHPEDRENLIKNIKESLETGKDFEAIYRIRCKSGEYRYWDERGKAIGFEDGKAVKWVGAVTDVTERKKSEEELLRREEQYRRLSREFNILFDAIVDNITLLSPDMKIMWANKAAASKFKKEVTQMKGEYCYKLCCNISGPCEHCPVAECFVSGKEEMTRIATSEGKFWDIRAFPIVDKSGAVKNVIEIGRDITAKVQMEEEAKNIQMRLIRENKMSSLGTLVSGVVHEINNPNSFILSNAQLLDTIWQDAAKILEQHQGNKDFLMGGIPFLELKDMVPKLINGINDGSIRIKNIVDNLKDFARPDRMSLDGKVDINKIIMVSRSILDNQISNYTDKFHVVCENNMPFVRGSAQQIEQVVINLIMNALQSLPEKKCGVWLAANFDKSSGDIVIQVKDEGVGMSDDILSKATDLFFTTRHESGGTGLGLSISYSIIKEHKGVMDIKSEPGKGTTVSVRLPLYNATQIKA